MKLDEIPSELKDKAEFACKVCIERYKSEHMGKFTGCSCRNIGKEYCPYIDKVLKEGG